MNLRAALRAALTLAAAGTVLTGCNLGGTQSAVLVDTDSTSGTTKTLDPFTVTGAWQIKYNFDCTKQDSEAEALDLNRFTVDVFNGDDHSTAFEHPQTTFVSVKRRGRLDFKKPGDYYLHIDTGCDWTLQVLDLSSGAVVSAATAPHVLQPHGTVALDVTFASTFGPYNCDLTGTAARVCVVGDGTAGTSPFGPLSMHITVAEQGGTGGCPTGTTTGALTAANGDVLNIKVDKELSCKAGTATYTFTVTGGTGIFKNATGSGTINDRHGASDRWSGSLTFAP